MTLFSRRTLLPLALLALLLLAVYWRSSQSSSRFEDQAARDALGLPPIPAEIAATPQLDEALARYYRSAVDTGVPLDEIAFLYHANGYYRQALQAYGKASPANDPNAQTRYLHALAALEMGNQEIALSLLRSLASDNTDYPAAYLRLGDVLLKRQRSDEAREAYQRALDAGASPFHACLGMAQTYLLTEDWDHAVAWLQRAIESNDAVSTPYTLLGHVYAEMGKIEKSKNALRESYLKREYPEPPDPWKESLLLNFGFVPYQLLVTAEIARESGRTDLADRLLERVRDVATNDPKALVELASFQLATEPGKAREIFQRAIELDPNAENAYLGLAQSYRAEAMLDQAFAAIDAGLEAIPASSVLHNYRGELFLSQKRPRPAREAFETAHQLNPMGLVTLRNLGSVLLAEGDPRGSELLQRYLSFQPDDQQVAGFYAQWLIERKGDPSAAIEILDKTLRSVADPSAELRQLRSSAFHRQAAGLLRQRELVQAAQAFQNAVDAWPENLEALANLGMLRAQLGEHEAAEQALAQFAAAQPENPLAWLNLGKARLLAERLPEALDAWQRGLGAARQNGNQSAAAELRQLISRFSQE